MESDVAFLAAPHALRAARGAGNCYAVVALAARVFLANVAWPSLRISLLAIYAASSAFRWTGSSIEALSPLGACALVRLTDKIIEPISLVARGAFVCADLGTESGSFLYSDHLAVFATTVWIFRAHVAGGALSVALCALFAALGFVFWAGRSYETFAALGAETLIRLAGISGRCMT